MPLTLAISINLGAGFAGLDLYGQLIKTDGTNITGLIDEGFYEVGEGFYIWEYAGFPENFRGGVKFYNQDDTSKVLSFIDITTENISSCSNEECVGTIGETFDITYSDQPDLTFYALLFSAEDLTKAWKISAGDFSTYTLASHESFVIPLTQDSERLGWYSYTITDLTNIPVVVGDQYYFIEVWQQKGSSPDRTVDLNTGTLRVCWGKASGEWFEIAKKVWEYGTRTLTSFPVFPPGITPKEIWEYTTRTLTENGVVDCNFTELEAALKETIKQTSGVELAVLLSSNKELANSLEKTFALLETCCSSKGKGTPNIQTPRIGPRGSKGRGSDMRFQ